MKRILILLFGALSASALYAQCCPCGAALAPIIIPIFIMFIAAPIGVVSGMVFAHFFLKNTSYSVDRMCTVQVGLTFFTYYLLFQMAETTENFGWHDFGMLFAINLLVYPLVCWFFFSKLSTRDIVLLTLFSLLVPYLFLGIFMLMVLLLVWWIEKNR